MPFPVASVAAALLAVIGTGAALVKRETTGYGQHVETSLLDALLFLNAAPIFHREGRRPKVTRQRNSVILRLYETADGRSMMVNLSGTERWRELCRLLDIDDGGLDYGTPEGLAKLSDREWNRAKLDEITAGLRRQDGRRVGIGPAASDRPPWPSATRWPSGWRASRHRSTSSSPRPTIPRSDGSRCWAHPYGSTPRPGNAGRGRRHGGEQGALAGHRIVDLSSFWAGPLASRLLAELGAEVVKVEPPGGEGGFQMMPVLPNIYVDGNRSKRGLVLDLKDAGDQARLRDLVAASDVVVENAMAGVWERLGLDEAALRAVNPSLIYARAKGFGIDGPLASRPSFDYVVQAATGMEMTQGGNAGPRPGNVVVNDYGTGLLLAAGVVCALLGRARGVAVTTVDASLAMTASLYQAGDVATLAVHGALGDQVGDEARGPSVGRRLYRTKDGWVTVCCVTEAQVAQLGAVTGCTSERRGG